MRHEFSEAPVTEFFCAHAFLCQENVQLRLPQLLEFKMDLTGP